MLSPSSRGLGHRPFTAVTGVRIPVGTPFKDDFCCLYCSLKNWKQAEKLKRFSKESLSRKILYEKGIQVLAFKHNS